MHVLQTKKKKNKFLTSHMKEISNSYLIIHLRIFSFIPSTNARNRLRIKKIESLPPLANVSVDAKIALITNLQIRLAITARFSFLFLPLASMSDFFLERIS